MLSMILIVFHFVGFYLNKQSQDTERNNHMLREKLKDAKRMLLSNMDPFIVETLKEIVKKDLRKEIEEMR